MPGYGLAALSPLSLPLSARGFRISLRLCRLGMLPWSVVCTVYVLFTKELRRVLFCGPLVRSVRTESSILIQTLPL